MDVSRIAAGQIKINQNPFQKVETDPTTTSFSNVIKGYLEKVNNLDKQASDLTVKAAAGQVQNIHDVTIASQKAKVALELTVTIRDKAVETYQEMMRMQF